MDPLTHSLVGGAVARTRLGGGTRFAAAALVLGANLPDVDVLSLVAGSDASLGFRRGWTHGPLALVILPLLLTGVLVGWDAWGRRRGGDAPPARPGRLLGLAYLGCLTHPLLDWLNTYGVRFLMPFDDRWYYGDAVFIIDPWLWLLLGATVFLGSPGAGVSRGWWSLAGATSLVVLLAREGIPLAVPPIWVGGLVAIALLRRVPSLRGRPAAIAKTGLILALLYLVAMIAATNAASQRVQSELDRRGLIGVRDLMIGPMPANPFRWDVVAATRGNYRHGTFSWFPAPALELDPKPIAKPIPSAVLEAAAAAPAVRGAMDWMRFPFVEIDQTADGYTVYFLDARYVRGRTDGFGSAMVRLDRELRVIDP